MEFTPPTTQRPEGIRLFRIQLAVLVVLYTLAVYAGMFALTRTLLLGSLNSDAASYVDLIVDMRAWNSSHGGVWVLKSNEVTSNPYLDELGVTPDVRTESSAVLTLRNPAMMTREISELTQQRSGVSFHLTSLEYLNPDNAPDAWEREALEGFDEDPTPVAGVSEIDGVRYYRYTAPLGVDESCLSCHASQGYAIGDTRGAITVSIPMAETDEILVRAAYFLAGMTVLTLIGALFTLRLLLGRMEARVAAANQQLTEMALTDGLTGLLNRGATFARLEEEFERARRNASKLCVIMIDLDHFKQVNDSFGHAAGDCTLKTFAARMHESVRAYDVVGRIGGEEFLVIAPGTDQQIAYELAERIRQSIASTPFKCGAGVSLTVSAGVATLLDTDEHIDSLVLRADTALYAAKAAGRDRVEIAAEADDER